MALEFKESLTVTVPNVEEQLSAFSERAYSKSHGLIIEVAAIHEGMTANFNFYGATALEGALASWVLPYPKPIILNHDIETEPVGRVMAAKMETEADGTPFTKLQVAVLDPNAIAKVLDQRYLTGSVGGRANEASCSVCGANWAKASMFELPCKHQKGKTYKGKLAYLEMKDITFKEYSFVNVPADQRSTVRAVQMNAPAESESDDWVRPVKLFSLDMSRESIVELSESENRNVLEGMRKKDAAPIYMQIKGAFISTLATVETEEDADHDNKESNVDDTILEGGDEDILAVAEGLSADLSATTEAEEAEVEEEEAATEDVAEEEASEVAEETTEEEETAEAVEEAPEAQERPTDESKPPVTRESDEEAAQVEEEEAVEEAAEVAETDLNEAVAALESRVNELEAREQSLLEENARLKAALKRGLAERVVDTKIATGLIEAADREAQLAEHVNRSASSLADSLRDLAAMPIKVVKETPELPFVDAATAAVAEEGNVVTEGAPEEVAETAVDPEEVLVDVFMGRRSL